MKRLLAVCALAGAMIAAGSALAQGQGGKEGGRKQPGPAAGQGDDLKKLEDVLEGLRRQVKELEAEVKKAAAEGKKEKLPMPGEGDEPRKKDRGFDPKGPPERGDGPKDGKKEGFKGDGPKGDKGPPDKGPPEKGEPPFGRKKGKFGPPDKGDAPKEGFRPGGDRPGGDRPGGGSIEDRLDRIIREVEDIRRELRKKQ